MEKITQIIVVDSKEAEKYMSSVLLSDTRVISKTDVAKRLRVTYNTVMNMCKDGRIRTTADNKITEQAFADYLNSTDSK